MCVQLQYIRAIAALLVVYFHAILQLEKLNPDAWMTDYLFGKSGVDLFFVLSGFVMWITTSDKPQTVTDFWWKRVRRVVPLYWAVTLAAAMVALVLPQILKSTQFDVPHILASLAPDLLDRRLADRSLYGVLEAVYGLVFDAGDQTIDASLADAADAKHLQIPKGSAVLLLQRRSYTGGVCAELGVSTYRADRYQIHTALGNPPPHS